MRVVDSFGNTVSGYRGTVGFSSDDATRLPARYTFTTADAGAHTFSVIFGTLGAHAPTASDQQASGLSGSLDVVVAPGATALGLNVTGLTATTAGVPQAVTVSAVGPGGETRGLRQSHSLHEHLFAGGLASGRQLRAQRWR